MLAGRELADEERVEQETRMHRVTHVLETLGRIAPGLSNARLREVVRGRRYHFEKKILATRMIENELGEIVDVIVDDNP